mgnify:CR=1 FL=1
MTALNEEAKTKLVNAWIAAQEAKNHDSWAIVKMGDIPQFEPELGWELILQIHAQPLSVGVRGILATSPLEDLLVYHGEAFLPRVKELALRDPVFHKMLESVWLDDGSPISEAFQALVGEVSTPDED